MLNPFASQKQRTTSISPSKHISTIPPHIVANIFSFLPVPDLKNLACVCRRFKVITYSDQVYQQKLVALGMSDLLSVEETEPHLELKESLQAKLRQLPGGQFLPLANIVKDEIQEKENALDTIQLISSALPDTKSSDLIIGAGGIKQALKQNQAPKNALDKRKSTEPPKRPARETFQKIFSELLPYYLDFQDKTNDSRVFQDYKDLSEIGAVLSRLALFDKCHFLSIDTSKISFGLRNAIEWFESTLLGQFDAAYDKIDTKEMRRNAYASFQLNGGLSCVQVFISKNPLFFDHTFNPSLLQSKLPVITGPSLGYALADEFAKFMDHLLTNCKIQTELISKVFVPDVNAMTLLISRVFEDSIAEYLNAVITAAKAREGLAIYLHTLATSTYSCSQFVNYIIKNPFGIKVDPDIIKGQCTNLFLPYLDSFLEQELEYLKKKTHLEIEKWDNRKKIKKGGVGYLENGEKVIAHKNKVMNTMKSIMFAPVVLTNSLLGGRKQNSESLLENAEDVDVDTDLQTKEKALKKDTATYGIDDNSMNSLVSLELAIHLMHTNKESLGRVLVVTANSNLSKLRPSVQKVFISLLKTLGEKHLKPAFAAANERLSKSVPLDFQDGKQMVNMESLQFFDLIHMGDLIQQMIEVYYNEDIRLWIDEQDFLSDIIIEKKSFERLLDDSVAVGMDKAVQVLVNQCEFLLISLQLQTDYNPTGKDTVFDFKPTKACEEVCKCLDTHTKVLTGCIEKGTMEVFQSEVAARVIIKNIRRLQVSQTGAMQLICDFNRYFDWAYSLRMTPATKTYQALKELGNLFLADGSEELRSLVHDMPRFNGALRIEEIYELLQSRTDYKEIRKQVEAKECIIQ